jgi:hypothetical protein
MRERFLYVDGRSDSTLGDKKKKQRWLGGGGGERSVDFPIAFWIQMEQG